MNTVCPGFMPHHVKPNRCRRCFKDIHDHDAKTDVSITLPLPRRRRESATAAISSTTSASFTIASEPRRRARASSTSSWFDEKKVNREEVDALFKHADDSRASYHSTESNETPDTVAVIKLPEVRRRARPTQDEDKPPELPPKTGESRSKRTETDLTQSQNEIAPVTSTQNETPKASQNEISKVNNSSIDKDKKTPESKPISKVIESKFGQVKLRDTKSEIRSRASKFEGDSKPLGPAKSPEVRTPTPKSYELKSKDTDKTTEVKPSETPKPKWGEAKPLKPVETSTTKELGKTTESKSISTPETKTLKPWELKSSRTLEQKSKELANSTETKPTKLAETKSKELASTTEAKSVKPIENKPKEQPKSTDSKPKPVLARFPSFRSTVEPPVSKPTPAKSKVSSTSEETESEESEEEEPPSSKPKFSTDKSTKPSLIRDVKQNLTSKDQNKPTTDVSFVVKVKPKPEPNKEPKPAPPKESKPESNKDIKPIPHKESQEQVLNNKIQNQEDKIKELQKTIDQLNKQLKRTEDNVSKLEREKTELQKKKQEKEKESAQELTKMKNKMNEVQASQDEVKQENKKLKQELKEALAKKEASSESKSTIEQLKQKLAHSEALCEELMEENEEIKKEVRDLEQELEELHDNFREDQASEFRGLKKELETATKNCRVLQFKLRKAEKKCELLELDRHSLEDRVREYQSAVRQDVDRSKLKELEKELSLSRNLTVSLNREIEDLKQALLRAESENEELRSQNSGGKRSVTPTSQSRLSPAIKDYETLTHELYDTMERESDLREQLKFSEEEAKTARRKIGALEQENETLMLQIKRLTSRLRNKEDDDEEVSPEQMKIQLELQEQEMGVLRRKLDDMEKENENLLSEVKYLQEKVINQPLIELPELPKESGSAYWEHKVRQQEYEIRETRRKLIEKERDIERLNAEVAIYRKKASKTMVRSRSLDSDIQVDLKKQLQLVEQEASILRQKVSTMENENDKLTTENKRLTLRLSKKPPLTSVDLLQLDNMELKHKLEEQQRKLEALTGESALLNVTENESDLIASLKRRLKVREEEHKSLQEKATNLEAENTRLSREFKKLKDCLGAKKRPAKAVRDSATRTELRELVGELQDEISDLQVNLRSREVLQEGLEEELEKAKKELRDANKEIEQKEQELQTKEKHEKEHIKKDENVQRDRTVVEEAEKRAKAAEEALEKKTQRLRDTQEKLNALKEDMSRSTRILESQKADLQKELDEQKNLLLEAETKATDLRRQMDKTDSELASLRKECNQLRNELEDERTRWSDKRHTDVSWNREREDMRRTTNELRNRIEHLQHQITENEKIWIEKESRLREDFKRKKEIAIREAREKGEAALELAKEEEKILRNKLQETTETLEKLENSLRESSEKNRQAASHHRREKDEWQTQRDNLEAEIRAEKKKREKAEREAEQAVKQKDEEVLMAKERLVAAEREQRRTQMQLDELEQLKNKIRIAESDTERAKQEYDHLTSRYEQLEDEFVKTKASLVQDKEKTANELVSLQREHNHLLSEMNSLKETYSSRQDSWIKEKLDLQERLKELNRRQERLRAGEQEKRRLQDELEEKDTIIENCKKEEKTLKDERDRLRKRVEDLTKIAEGRSDKSTLYNELESTRKDYESRMALMSAEITDMQSQIANLVAERDELKSQLSSVERTAEEMRTGSLKRERARHREEADAARRKVQELRYQLEDLREQLDDSGLENKNLKLQNETERNAFEIQIAELKSKINQLEEQKMLESTRGQSRSIAKTRLELAWEKERGELQHLLAENNKLVADLKNRVEKAELDKEKDKQANRKQMLDMRSSVEKERQESRRKLTELHSSLLEIRESHAKLRGMYDRMKKEREILLREREEWRQRLQTALQLHGKLTNLLPDVEKLSSEIVSNVDKPSFKITPDFKEIVQKVKENVIELQKTSAVLKEDEERMKRSTSFRRAVSAQEVNLDPIQRWNNPQRVTNYPLAPPSMIIRPPPRQRSLQRKSLSLDQHLVGASHGHSLKIWESEGESGASTPAGSVISLGGYGYETDSSLPDSEYRYGGIVRDRRRYHSGMTSDSEFGQSSREGSLDPGGSAESVPLSVQNQRKTLKEKLKLLRRAKSIDVASGAKPGAPETKQEKELSLRSKISKVLKKPLGRSSSMETRKNALALPPKGVVPDVIPSRPTTQKPLSSSRGDISKSIQDNKRTQTNLKPGWETPV